MARKYIKLQPSEMSVARSAATIYAAYIASGKVVDGQQRQWLERAAHEAIELTLLCDDLIQSDTETN
ncbi:MAG TPA: hypothetical protein DCQ98_09320 [Planctomycetaceae bacterium]|nr:hypothetical protein [Planctomycetaceae bacterium]HRF01575.1 hypothetical protein [Pirellulaceae bacterium]